MLAILDPDLRRVGPTRRQSASLIAALALVSLTIGATAPVARRAEAAPATAAAHSAAPITVVVSAEPAKSWSNTIPQKPASLSHEMPPLVPPPAAPPTAAASLSVSSSSNATHALEVISSEGARFGMSVAQNLLRGYGDKADPSARNADDRPALLAKVLRTDTSAIIRRVAAWGLQEYADQQVVADALTNALRHDPDARVREMAAWSLAESRDRTVGASDALVDALKKDASDRVRTTAAWARRVGSVQHSGSIHRVRARIGHEDRTEHRRADGGPARTRRTRREISRRDQGTTRVERSKREADGGARARGWSCDRAVALAVARSAAVPLNT